MSKKGKKDKAVVDEQQKMNQEVSEAIDNADLPDTEETAMEETPDNRPTVMRVIEIPMEDEELLAVATELTDLLTIIEELEAEKKAKNASYNANIGEKQKSAHELSNKFKSAVHTSERECPLEYNWEAGEKKILHPDSGDVLFTDAISNDERQKFMPGFENQVEGSENMACGNTTCASEVEGRCMKEGADATCGDYIDPESAIDEAEDTDLMLCASDKCADVLEGKCTRPDGSIECHGYEVPEGEPDPADADGPGQ